MNTKIVKICLINLFVSVSVNALNLVPLNTPADIKKYSQSKPLICLLSLDCSLGSQAITNLAFTLDDLDGPNIGGYNINTFPREIINGFEIGLLHTVIIMDNKVVASTAGDKTVFHEMSGDTARRIWIAKKLNEFHIPHTMKTPTEWRAKPIDEPNTKIDLQKGNIAWMDFETTKDKSQGNAILAENKDEPSGIKNGTYFIDGIYNKAGRKGLELYSPVKGNLAANSFSFGVNIKLDSTLVPIHGAWEILSTANMSVRLMRSDKGKLKVIFKGIRPKPENQLDYWEWEDFYLLNEVDFKLDVWMNFQISVDLASKRLKIFVDGKRLDDLLLQQKAIDLVKKDSWNQNELICQFGSAGRGSILYGYADDFVFYNRALSSQEQFALSQRDSKVKKNNIVTPTPSPIPNPKIDSEKNLAVWIGSWETFWGSTDQKTTGLEMVANNGKITGKYKYEGGTLSGSAIYIGKDAVLNGIWTQTNGKKGWFTFTLSKNGSEFKGLWGYEGDREPRESWSGYRNIPNFGKSLFTESE